MNNFSLVCESLEKSGYVLGAPSAEIYYRDEERCATKPCLSCGSPYHRLNAYHRAATDDYKAYARCYRCGHWEILL